MDDMLQMQVKYTMRHDGKRIRGSWIEISAPSPRNRITELSSALQGNFSEFISGSVYGLDKLNRM